MPLNMTVGNWSGQIVSGSAESWSMPESRIPVVRIGDIWVNHKTNECRVVQDFFKDGILYQEVSSNRYKNFSSSQGAKHSDFYNWCDQSELIYQYDKSYRLYGEAESWEKKIK